jgi:hypothetical protein
MCRGGEEDLRPPRLGTTNVMEEATEGPHVVKRVARRPRVVLQVGPVGVFQKRPPAPKANRPPNSGWSVLFFQDPKAYL